MDAPLVLTPIIDPKEVDDEVHGIELVNNYPLDFYYATLAYKSPGEVKLRTVKDTLGSTDQLAAFPLTHPGGSMHDGNLRTSYVELKSVPEKISRQFTLQDKIRAVDSKNAAERLITSHFIPDLYGNLHSFSRQNFRCTNCNTSYRRVPLAGRCTRCGGNLLLTIHKGGIQEYLEI
jgi:DNA polymerase II large subunit